jgi:hypothetical protein
MAPGFAILANSVQIRWQSTDSGILATGTATVTSTGGNSSLSPATGHKLSGAAIGGIVIGAFFGVVVVIVIVIGCYFFRPRRRVNGEGGKSIKDTVEGRFSRPGLEGTVYTAPGNDTTQGLFSKPELGDTQVRPARNARTREDISELGGVDIHEV